MNFLFPLNASVFTGEQSFVFIGREGGWALGGARNRNPVGEFLLVRLGSSLCASSGLVLFGVRVLGVKSLEGLTLFIEYPFPHAAIACSTRCVGSYSMGFGVFLLSLALWRFYRPCDLLRVFQSR